MAIGTPYNVGTASNKDSTSITITTTTSVPAGDSIFLAVLSNVINVTNPTLEISDSAGNNYAYVVSFVDVSGSILIYWVDNSVALNSGSTITITYIGAEPTPLMAAGATGVNGIDSRSVITSGAGNSGASTTPTVTAGGLINGKNYLALSFLATEGPTGDTFTQDTAGGWASPPVRVGTTGGAAATNNTLAGGYLIANNITSVTYNPTITNRNWIVGLLVIQEAVANTLYWVGGSGSWTEQSANGWSATSGGTGGAGVPTGETNVVIDGGSDAGGPFTITLATSISSTSEIKCKNLTITGLDSTVTINQSVGTSIKIFGDVSIPSSNVAISSINLLLNFLGSSSTQLLNTNGANYPIELQIGGTSTVQLQNNWITTDQTITLNSGGFNANNYNVEIASFSTSTNSAKTISMGSGTWTIKSNVNSWVISGTGVTLNKGTSTIIFTTTSTSSPVPFNGGGLNYHNITIAGNTTSNTFEFSDSNTFNTFTSTKTVAFTLKFQSGTTNTFNNFTVTGTSGNVVTLSSITAGTQATLQKYSPWRVGANSTNVSGNTGLSFTGGGGLDYLTIQDINGVELEPLTKSNMFLLF